MSNHAFRYTRLILMLIIMLSILTVTASATTATRPAASTPAKGRTATSPTMPTPSAVVPVPQSAPQGVATTPATATDNPFRYAPDAAVPLTPEGNLTLQDDLQNTVSDDLQFLTVRTKAGNTFYLVIDRVAKENNVHFLNLVDEADLLALLKKEAGGASLDGFGSASGTTGTGAGNDSAGGGFSLDWPGSGDSASSNEPNRTGTGDDSTSSSEAPHPTAAPAESNSPAKPGTPHVSNDASPPLDSSAPAPEDSFASKKKAYASLGFLLLLLVSGGVFWLVRTLRKRKALRAKHPTDEYLYVEEPEVPDSADRQEGTSRQDARIETDEDGEDLA